MSKKPKKLCPFKKSVTRTFCGKGDKITMQERFDVCAGERCMAYRESYLHDGSHCRRLDGGRA